MKRTPFHSLHLEAGAKLVEFAGFEMPVQYEGIIPEHRAVRSAVGVFDVSHMGEFIVSGRDARAFLQSMTTNDVAKLSEGRAQYSAMCYDDGGIVDDLLVYNVGTYYMMVVNASNTAKDYEWLRSHLKGDVYLEDVSDRTALLAIQGPLSLATLQKLVDVTLASLPYYHFMRATVAGIPMIVSRTGYTGELGFELYFDADPSACITVWKAVFDAGKEFGIAPVGLGARDTLRLEMGYCLYGNDIDETTNPLEAGLGWITKLDKGDFVGREALLRIRQQGLKRRLVGFRLEEKGVARHGYPLRNDGTEVGVVTSGTFSPTLQQGIGMGYVELSYSEPGASVNVLVRGRSIPATVVRVPFLQRS